MTTVAAALSIANTLGVGSGLDINALVTQLAAAQKAPQEALITTRDTANKAQVSALAGLTSGIDSFSTALNSLIGGGTLFTQPTSSNSGALGVSAIAGGRIGGLSANLQINQLAQGQTLVSSAIADASATIGQGGMTLTTSRGTFHLTIGGANGSLTGLAGAINAASAGITASVLNDGTGSRLVLKGPTGASAGFTLTADSGADAGLLAYTYDGSGGGLTKVQGAQDASLMLDGVAVARSGNSISDLIPGVKLDLTATTTSAVAIGSTQPVAAMREAVIDFVDSFNALKSTLDTDIASGIGGATAGPFTGDSTVRDMVRQLGGLASTPLVSSGAVKTLADIGVRTGNDGKLSVDTDRLDAVLASNPDDVEALFNPTQSSSNPLVQITSGMGKTAPGSYTLTNLLKGPPPSGKINGEDFIVAGSRLVAPIKSGAGGLVIALTGDVASSTITVEAGLGGALQSIRDRLRAASGPLQALSDRLTTQATQISNDSAALDTRSDAYQAQLQTTFNAMNSRVTSLKATQSYLTQQIAVWTNSLDSNNN